MAPGSKFLGNCGDCRDWLIVHGKKIRQRAKGEFCRDCPKIIHFDLYQSERIVEILSLFLYGITDESPVAEEDSFVYFGLRIARMACEERKIEMMKKEQKSWRT